MSNNISTPSDLTLRDYFAAKAMQAFLSDPELIEKMAVDLTAAFAYMQADAMMEARDDAQ